MQIAPLVLKNTDFMKNAISQLKKGLDKETLDEVGEITAYYLGFYAPEDTGALRTAYKVKVTKNAVSVSWGNSGSPADKYAHYQYVGIAMEPVRPIFEGNNLWTDQWRTPKGVKKVYAKDRHPIGIPHTVVYKDGRVAFVKGYSVHGSSDHWIEKAVETPKVYNPMRRQVYEMLADAIGEKVVGKRYFTKYG